MDKTQVQDAIKTFNEMKGSKSLLLSNASSEFELAFTGGLSAFRSPTGFKVHAIGFRLNIQSEIADWKFSAEPNYLKYKISIDFEDKSRLVLGVSHP